MAHWREEYSAALAARDRREKANQAIYDAYTNLADRTARLAAAQQHQSSDDQQQQHHPNTNISPSPSSSALTPSTSARPSKHPHSLTQSPAPPSTLQIQESLLAARTDLSEAQRSRSELQDRLTRTTTELEKLRKRGTLDGRRVHALESEVSFLQLRAKDRDEELRGKAKLLEDFQDELASLNLQLNMAEERSSRLQRENQELVDRWMARMGKEAEAMNAASKYS
ncbi:autophagy protein 16 [Aspergillus heteromorphus CBS 117.55]|uniref:Autophagy protein 16 n=1 Tax=Aspergillus heteromorphus CBS 117.55 TaxID=1448321 RepID=A0A317WI48_9EURO|nr:autophagy protein 16 [Aspergillus heteromorphus CBS 117.55]PWY84952.1 autophagy protein 16 [Aspergillus heteromorphus CBS 117.55]